MIPGPKEEMAMKLNDRVRRKPKKKSKRRKPQVVVVVVTLR